MPRTLYVTHGEFAGRYMRMEDDVAERAIADGWARENEAEPEPDPDNPNPVEDPLQEVPDSLVEFENPPEPEPDFDQTANIDETAEVDQSQRPAKATRKSSRKRYSS